MPDPILGAEDRVVNETNVLPYGEYILAGFADFDEESSLVI